MALGVGRGQNVGIIDFCHILTLLPPWSSMFHKHMSSCCMVSFFFYRHFLIYFNAGLHAAFVSIYEVINQVGLWAKSA